MGCFPILCVCVCVCEMCKLSLILSQTSNQVGLPALFSHGNATDTVTSKENFEGNSLWVGSSNRSNVEMMQMRKLEDDQLNLGAGSGVVIERTLCSLGECYLCYQ